jgi:hypothetical protein
MGGTPDKYRIQLDFTPEAFRELERLKGDVGVSSRADTVRYGMRVLRWVINSLRSGGQIMVDRNGVRSEIEFPFLPHAEPAAAEARDDVRKTADELRDYMRKRTRERVGLDDHFSEQQKEQFRAAYEAGRQAYRETSPESSQQETSPESPQQRHKQK